MLKCRSLDDSNHPITTVYNIRIGSWREEFVRRSCNLVPGDFDWWQKDSPYGLLLIIRCATRSRRAFDCREATVLSRNDAHLFGVCCIIRTRNRASPEQLIVLFFLPLAGKRVSKIYCSAPRAVLRIRIRHFSIVHSKRTSGSIRSSVNETISIEHIPYISFSHLFFISPFSLASFVYILYVSVFFNHNG